MESVEVSARTVEEAVEQALNKLGLSRDEVEVEVIREGRVGLFGFGGEEALVRVTPLRERVVEQPIEQADIAAIAEEVVEKLLFLMKVPATVQIKEQGVIPASATLDIDGDDLGILIGRRGQTLATLQYMVNLIVSRRLKSGAHVVIDVAGYRQRREEELKSLALRIAEIVKSSKRAITLEPMSPGERRVVHLTLRDDPEIITQSVGEEENRKVIISLRRR
jgi:spoIIIJ-associated protein